MTDSLHLVIMAGGSGTRFWPKSTGLKPKQLLAFGKDPKQTLIVETLNRFKGIVPESSDHTMIVTTEKLSEAIAQQTSRLDPTILAEPMGRNTAPCVYWAAREVFSKDPKGVMLLMPADHFIPGRANFQKTLREAIAWAEAHDDLVTLGVKPTRPETGYGYLKVGAELEDTCRIVNAFVEKPNRIRAEEFWKSGNYLWNGGMFVWRAEVILAAFDEFMPEMKRAWDQAGGDPKKAYPLMTATSVDFGIMERAKNVVTFELDCGWDDLGAWTSLESVSESFQTQAPSGVVIGGDVVSVESSGNIIDAPGKLVALLGVENLIVVEHGGTLFVAPKDRAQDMRLLIEKLKVSHPERL